MFHFVLPFHSAQHFQSAQVDFALSLAGVLSETNFLLDFSDFSVQVTFQSFESGLVDFLGSPAPEIGTSAHSVHHFADDRQKTGAFVLGHFDEVLDFVLDELLLVFREGLFHRVQILGTLDAQELFDFLVESGQDGHSTVHLEHAPDFGVHGTGAVDGLEQQQHHSVRVLQVVLALVVVEQVRVDDFGVGEQSVVSQVRRHQVVVVAHGQQFPHSLGLAHHALQHRLDGLQPALQVEHVPLELENETVDDSVGLELVPRNDSNLEWE